MEHSFGFDMENRSFHSAILQELETHFTGEYALTHDTIEAETVENKS